LSETVSPPTYDKCYYFAVKALGLADDEEKKFNHRRTKYYYVRNPNVEKSDFFCKFYIAVQMDENIREFKLYFGQVSIIAKCSIFQVVILI